MVSPHSTVGTLTEALMEATKYDSLGQLTAAIFEVSGAVKKEHVMPNSQVSEKEILHKNLMVALSALAQTKAEQLAYVHPGCAVCDLTEDLDTYGTRCIDQVEPTPAQRIAIEELRSLIRAFVATEQECFDAAVLDRLDWSSIRMQAERCLNLFGYRIGPLPRPAEVEPGVWRLDVLGHPLQPL